jgi:Ras-related protein Rab-11A
LAFIETSALDCSNVDLAFDRIINEIHKVVSQSAVADEEEEPAPKEKPQVEQQKKAGMKLE